MLLDKKYAVITGSNRGIGKAILKKFAENGCYIIAHARKRTKEFEEYLYQVTTENRVQVYPVYFDFNDGDGMKKAVQDILKITRKIDTQMDKIENFVEQALYYSRSDEVGKDYIIKKTELSQVVKSVVKKNQRDFIGKRISLQLGNLDEIIYSDTKWIEFILNQIIGNAIKYSKGKDDKIKIESKKLDNSVALIIEDNGVGIIERDLNRIFEKGFTGENGRKFGKSTGIGLYLCKKLCDKMGLGLNIESEENKGTKVTVIFPRTENLIH